MLGKDHAYMSYKCHKNVVQIEKILRNELVLNELNMLGKEHAYMSYKCRKNVGH
jgi:hypothetical protein